jgi:ADP-ribosylglycohydrolase
MKAEELEQLVKDEMRQKREEGFDVSRIEGESVEDLLKALGSARPRPDFPYVEPSELEDIRAAAAGKLIRREISLSDDELYDKIYGGWLGRCAGCLLGKPAEGLSREQIEQWLKLAGAYPLENYFPPPEELPENAPKWLKDRLSLIEGMAAAGVLRGRITCMPRDDDIDYTIVGLHVLENRGPGFTTKDIGEAWLRLLPYHQVYTAERAAYRNLVNGLEPPETATHMNPYREWIGAQIRADVWGYVAPGAPDLASKLAYRDARLSHTKNGVYGEIFVSAMISAAFATDDVREIVETGLSAIPEKSRLAEAVRDVIGWSGEFSDWRDTWEKISEKYGHYHPVHTINNASVVVMGLLHGEGDYEKSITTSVMGGWDTDCNGATTGSIVGVILGAGGLPGKWVKPLNDRVRSFVAGYNDSRISDLVKRTLGMAKKILEDGKTASV